MLFNTLEYALFLPIVFILYWMVLSKSLRAQNAFLLISSYVFYGWWDWRFLSLIVFSTGVDYFIGKGISRSISGDRKKLLLATSLAVNLGLLGFFKYFNFFSQSFRDAFSEIGYEFDALTIDIILPVGISFYTFQTLSYTIDVYRGNIKPTDDIISFAAFVSFFPQLVAGPIERASNLLPQFYTSRTFNYAKSVDGLRQILWGLVKKVIIADNCAVYANELFNNTADYSGLSLALGALFFTFQIYGDFSGYSDIAIGTARLFGFDLMKNFAFPYFSRDIAEFWRRWHISLSTWFRDYLYIPLGGSRGGTVMKVRNTFIIFIVSGFWHGANWTFIVWGALNAIYFLPLLLTNTNRKNLDVLDRISSFKNIMSVLLTFLLTLIAWVFFRAESIEHAINYLSRMTMYPGSFFFIDTYLSYIDVIIMIVVFVLIEWFGRRDNFAIEKLGLNWHSPLRYTFYYLLIVSLFLFGGQEQMFIYFQF